ncbi:MAG TPA: hypothetical protein DIW23_11750 [Anaerolineae bacterium]|nr:hypothetical protein [Anaerolineae bacterium]
MKRQIPYHGWCFVCGTDNPHSIGLTWFIENGILSAEFTLSESQQGPPGYVHGGASAAILDEAMGLVVWAAGYKVAAVNLQVDYHKPLPLNQKIFVEAKVDQAEERKISSHAEITNADSTIFVSASGIYVVAPQLFETVNLDKLKKNEKNN